MAFAQKINLSDLCFFLAYSVIWILGITFQEKIFDLHLSLTTILSILFLIMAVPLVIKKKIPYFDITAFLIYLLTSSFISYLFFGLQPNAIPELFKIIIVFSGGLLLARTLSEKTLIQVISPYPYVIISVLLFILSIWGNSTPAARDGRLGFYYSLGAPNTVGFLLASALLILVFQSSTIFRYRVLKWVYIFFGMILLTITYSRSAIFGFFIALILTNILYKKFSIIHYKSFLIVFAIFLSIFMTPTHLINHLLMDKPFLFRLIVSPPQMRPSPWLLSEENSVQPTSPTDSNANTKRFYYDQRFGSGRLGLWKGLINNSIKQPVSLAIGFGPGLIQDPQLRKIDTSTDSLIFLGWHSYGIIGLFIAIVFLIQLSFRKYGDTLSTGMLKTSFSLFLLFTLVINNSTSAQQVLLLGMFIVAFVFSKPDGYKKLSS